MAYENTRFGSQNMIPERALNARPPSGVRRPRRAYANWLAERNLSRLVRQS